MSRASPVMIMTSGGRQPRQSHDHEPGGAPDGRVPKPGIS